MIGSKTIFQISARRAASFSAKQSFQLGSRATFSAMMDPVMVSIPKSNETSFSFPLIAPQKRFFSTTLQANILDDASSIDKIEERVQKGPGHVTKTLRVLNMDVVKNILDELRSVDVNSDGRIDADELKQLLRKHNNAFTDEEITQIGELFYAGKSGGSVSFERFVEAIDKLVQIESEDSDISKAGNPLNVGSCGAEYLYFKSHGNYKEEDVKKIQFTHTEPQTLSDRLAYSCVKGVRFLFDAATGWNGEITTEKVMNRTIYLETIAAVPGMVAAIVRHFRSLRSMQRDGGKIQMFLEEAENERMHLLTFVRMKNPGLFFRAAVIGGQFGFGTVFGLGYVISPKFCHRFVGYIEEEAVLTYTKIVQAIESAPEGSDLGIWRTELAPKIARSYWHLGEHGTVLDLMYAVRADEAEHRDVNHLCSDLDETSPLPVNNTEQKLNTMLLKYVHDMMERNPEKPAKMAQTSM